MFEYRIIGAENINPNILRSCGASFCTYWHQWVIYADNKREALEVLNNVGVYCNVEKLN